MQAYTPNIPSILLDPIAQELSDNLNAEFEDVFFESTTETAPLFTDQVPASSQLTTTSGTAASLPAPPLGGDAPEGGSSMEVTDADIPVVTAIPDAGTQVPQPPQKPEEPAPKARKTNPADDEASAPREYLRRKVPPVISSSQSLLLVDSFSKFPKTVLAHDPVSPLDSISKILASVPLIRTHASKQSPSYQPAACPTTNRQDPLLVFLTVGSAQASIVLHERTLSCLRHQINHKFHIPPELPYRLTSHFSPLTAAHLLRHSDIQITLHLPIRGGNRSPGLQAQQTTIDAEHTQANLTIVTWNLNGCFKNYNRVNSNTIWDYVRQHKVDILFLIDHRSDLKTLKYIRREASTALRVDVTLSAAPVPIYSSTTGHNEWASSVGGVAVLAFGAVSPYLQNPSVVDPSGMGTYLVSILKLPNNNPIALVPVYLFPVSQGPTTLHTRIQTYLTSKGILQRPTVWQAEQLSTELHAIKSKHPTYHIISGGDLNTDSFAIPDSAASIFINASLTNLATLTNTNTITFPAKSKWIDHFVYSSGITLLYHHANYQLDLSSNSLVPISDHLPYLNAIRLPTSFTIKNSTKSLFHRANQANRSYDIPLTSHLAPLFQEAIEPRLSRIPLPVDTIASHEQFYDTIMRIIKHTARMLQPTYRHKPWEGWSPSAQLLTNFYRCLIQSRRFLLKGSHHKATKPIKQFYSKHYRYQNQDLTYRYRDLLPSLLHHDGEELTFYQLSKFVDIDTINNLIRITTSKNHYGHRKQLRDQISYYHHKQDLAVESGKFSRVISNILNKPVREGLHPFQTPSGDTYTDMHQLNLDINAHFTDHFSTRSDWIKQTCLDSDTPDTRLIHQSLLDGTWRQHSTTLLHTLPQNLRQDASAFFDTCKCKATPSLQQELHQALTNPVSFDEFNNTLHGKRGGKSPGPSGVTINHLKLLSPDTLKLLHSTLQFFYANHYVPQQWKLRTMALIPKSESATNFSQFRPIMLLDEVRKLWLTILKRRRDPILHSHNIFNRSQCGGISQSGTENAIFATINCLEDAIERQAELHILYTDKQRAFDAPRRFAGINLGWRRLGVSREMADYYSNLDHDNQIYAKTPHYLLHPSDTPSFHAEGGSSQGDTDATSNYNVVDDIMLDFLHNMQTGQDYYMYKSSQNSLIPQGPIQYIDDQTLFSRSIQGMQRAIDLTALSGILLNIYTNPTKFQHLCLQWKDGTMLEPISPMIHAYDDIMNRIPIQPCATAVLVKYLGAYVSANNKPDLNVIKHHQLSHSIASTLRHKKSSGQVTSTVLYSSVYPSLAYPLRFSNASNTDLNRIASPIHRVLKIKNNLDDFHHDTIFGDNSTPFALPHKNLVSYINAQKLSSFRRMTAGDENSAQIMCALTARSMRNMGSWDDPSYSPIYAPSTPLKGLDKPQSTWATSLIEWVKPALRPQLLNLPRTHPLVTQTSLFSLIEPGDDLTVDQAHTLLSITNLLYLEELYCLNTHTQADHQAHLTTLLSILPSQLHTFLARVYQLGLQMHITRSCIIFRPDIYVRTARNITQILHLAPYQQALTREWTHTTLTNHEWEHNTTLERMPLHYRGSRVLTREIPSATHYTIRTVEFHQEFYYPETAQPPTHSFHFPKALLTELPPNDLYIYTDAGYYTPHQGPGINEPSQSQTSISLVITTSPITPTHQPAYFTLYAHGPTFLSNPYQAELLAVSAAATLSTPKRKVHVITDCQSITSQLERLRTPNEYIPRTDLTPHLASIVYSNTTLTWVRAHSETAHETPSTYQYGNQIADAVASNHDTPSWAHAPINTYNLTLDSFIPTRTHSVTFTSADSQSTTLPSSRAIQQYIAKTSLHNYIINRHSTYYQHHRAWHPYTWTASGQAFKKMMKNVSTDAPISRKLFTLYYHKTLYDKFRNQAWKHKIDNPRAPNTDEEDSIPPPLCPLCNLEPDSMTHLLGRCTHSTITTLRANCIHSIAQEFTAEDTTCNYQRITQALYQDSRAWACLLPVDQYFSSFVSTASKVLQHTIPAVYNIMKTYNTITHVTLPQPPIPPLLSLLNRKGKIIRTRTAPVKPPVQRPRKRQAPPTQNITFFFPSNKTQHQQTPSTHIRTAPVIPSVQQARKRQPPPSHDIKSFFLPNKPQHQQSSNPQWISPTKTSKRALSTPPPSQAHHIPRRILVSPESIDLNTHFAHLQVEEHDIADIPINNTFTTHTTPTYHSEVVFNQMPSNLDLTHIALMIDHKLEQVPGDGNCMLHSIKKSILHQNATFPLNLEPKSLRHSIHTFLHSPFGRDICTRHAVRNNELHAILPTSRSNGDYLEHWAAIALQHILKINITIYQLTKLRDHSHHMVKHTAIINSIYPTISILHHNNNHFSSLFPHQPP